MDTIDDRVWTVVRCGICLAWNLVDVPPGANRADEVLEVLRRHWAEAPYCRSMIAAQEQDVT